MSDKPRFIFEISDEQRARADKLIGQYGIRRALFSIILDDLLDLIELHGGMAIGAILTRNIKPSEAIPILKSVAEINDGKLT